MNPAYISAFSILVGSAIGAFASLVTPRVARRHEDESRRRAQEIARRERICIEFIDLASHAFVDALVHTSMEDPSKIIPLYATIAKLRLFASAEMVAAAEKVMNRVIETYYAPKLELQTTPAVDSSFDVLREFSETCRAELAHVPAKACPRLDRGWTPVRRQEHALGELSPAARPASRLPDRARQAAARWFA